MSCTFRQTRQRKSAGLKPRDRGLGGILHTTIMVRPALGSSRRIKVAVEGCCHGQLDAIYKSVRSLEKKNNYKVDLLLICGDYQAMRTQADLNCMASPSRHRQMGDYHKYYTRGKVAPVPTVVIGGNHEASNHFWELYHGGWLARNIYYLGHVGVVNFNGLRIAGTSGIFKPQDYKLGYYETLPYDRTSIRSIYHTREYVISKLSQISPPDIFMSHDWPLSIEQHGDTQDLLRRKPNFAGDVLANTLGSPPLMDLLKKLRPKWWFSGHMHCRFDATVVHGSPPTVEASEPNPTSNVSNQADGSRALSNLSKGAPVTQFLALDKCSANREFLEVFDIEVPQMFGPPKFTFDAEWLAITRAFHPYLSLTREQTPLPHSDELQTQIAEAIEWVKQHALNKDGSEKEIGDVQRFVHTSPGPVRNFEGYRYPAPSCYTNPQTVAFCNMLGIENKINPSIRSGK